jgi:hypothetical protein
MSSIEGVNEIDYKGCTIKTTENSNGSWYWKIDTNYTSLSIYPDNGEETSERYALQEAKKKIDEAVKNSM